MAEKILQRIIKETGINNLVEVLTDRLSLTDLKSLLLTIYRNRVERVTPGQLLKHYHDNRFFSPSVTDVTLLLKLDLLAFSLLPSEYKKLALSPVSPLGTCSVVAPVDQNWVITAIRNCEVIADATNVLGLECGKQRQSMLETNPKSRERIRICASHRHIRTQPFENEKFTPHFTVFCLVTAGRDEGNYIFEQECLMEHISFYIRFLRKVIELSAAKKQIEVFITNFDGKIIDIIQSQVLDPLKSRFPGILFSFNQERKSARHYYDNICFNIRLRDEKEVSFDYLVDGGFTDWTQKLISNKKERLLTSGIGTELLTRTMKIDF